MVNNNVYIFYFFSLLQGISDEVFVSLAAMLPSVFRVSNPLVFKASSAPITPKTS